MGNVAQLKMRLLFIVIATMSQAVIFQILTVYSEFDDWCQRHIIQVFAKKLGNLLLQISSSIKVFFELFYSVVDSPRRVLFNRIIWYSLYSLLQEIWNKYLFSLDITKFFITEISTFLTLSSKKCCSSSVSF